MGQASGNQLFFLIQSITTQNTMTYKIQKSDAEWKALLRDKGAEPLAFEVTRDLPTENIRIFTPMAEIESPADIKAESLLLERAIGALDDAQVRRFAYTAGAMLEALTDDGQDKEPQPPRHNR